MPEGRIKLYDEHWHVLVDHAWEWGAKRIRGITKVAESGRVAWMQILSPMGRLCSRYQVFEGPGDPEDWEGHRDFYVTRLDVQQGEWIGFDVRMKGWPDSNL